MLCDTKAVCVAQKQSHVSQGLRDWMWLSLSLRSCTRAARPSNTDAEQAEDGRIRSAPAHPAGPSKMCRSFKLSSKQRREGGCKIDT